MKIGIFIPGANGDILYSTAVIKYKDDIWGAGCTLVWFCCKESICLLENTTDVIVRLWDHNYDVDLAGEHSMMDLSKKNMYETTSDLDIGYFVSPCWLDVTVRGGLNHLSECCRYAMGILHRDIVWRPYIELSESNHTNMQRFFDKLPKGRKNIMLETHYKSDQSKWNDNMTTQTLQICAELLGKCNFLFASNVHVQFTQDNVYTCTELSLKEISALHDHCDLFIGVSSGVSVAISCWRNKPVPIIQFCADYWASTFPVTNAPMELVTNDLDSNRCRKRDGSIVKVPRIEPTAELEFYRRLRLLLKEI